MPSNRQFPLYKCLTSRRATSAHFFVFLSPSKINPIKAISRNCFCPPSSSTQILQLARLFFYGTHLLGYSGLRLCNPTWHVLSLVGCLLALLMPKLITHSLTHDLEPANSLANWWPIDQQPRTGACLRLLAHAPVWVPPRTCTCVVLLGERQNASMPPQRIYRWGEDFPFPAKLRPRSRKRSMITVICNRE